MQDGRRCTGVRYSVASDVHEACVSREVVVSAGTINSPRLLELSGIGQPERLGTLGIAVRHALPGVGENLRDHYVPRTRWRIGKKGIIFNDRGRGLGLAHQAMRYALFRQVMLAMAGAPIRAFVCSREGLEDGRTDFGAAAPCRSGRQFHRRLLPAHDAADYQPRSALGRELECLPAAWRHPASAAARVALAVRR